MSKKKQIEKLETEIERLHARNERLEHWLSCLEETVFNIYENQLSQTARESYPSIEILLDIKTEIATWIYLTQKNIPFAGLDEFPLPDKPVTKEKAIKYIANIYSIEPEDIYVLRIDKLSPSDKRALKIASNFNR